MICCKIISNYDILDGDFSQLLNELGKFGNIKYENSVLYYGSTEVSMTEKKILNILRKCNYKNFFIDVYTKENQPRETDDSINGWLVDQLIKINYQMYENESQEVFRNISKGLDILEKQINELREKSKNKVKEG